MNGYLLQNLRASRETEFVHRFPSYLVTKWLGHSERVANEHDLHLSEDHFRQALQDPMQQAHARPGMEANDYKTADHELAIGDRRPARTLQYETSTNTKLGQPGLEP